MATRLSGYKDIPLNLIGGMFDAQSPAGEAGPNNYRVVLNMAMTEERKRCRMGGWVAFGRNSQSGMNNQDLHDQLLDCMFYYQTLSQSFSGGGEQTGWAYPYHSPETVIGGVPGPIQSFGPYEGDAEDYYGVYPYIPVPNELFIQPDYLDGYYDLRYFTQDPDQVIPAYDWGVPFPTYSSHYSYNQEYCSPSPLKRLGCREPITLMYESVSDAGKRKMFVGTSTRLYLLNEGTGNYRILADGLGIPPRDEICPCDGRQYSVAQVGNVVLLSNNYDPVLYWKHDTSPHGCDYRSVDYVSDLMNLGVYRAKVLASWQGFVFLGDVEVNGIKYPYRIYWSDFNAPLTWAPGGESLALYTDLAAGERVDRIEPLGGQLRVYTSKGSERAIYEVLLVGGDEIFSFREIYRGPEGLAFRNSLVNIGDTHIYISEQDVMVLGEFDRSPKRIEWVHKAGGTILNGLASEVLKSFDGLAPFGPINRNKCDQAIGGFDSVRDVVWFSWPTDDNDCPNMSLALNLKYKSSTLVDHGFTSFLTHRPDYSRSLRDFLAEYAGCTPKLLPKEGEPYELPQVGERPDFILNPTEDPTLDSTYGSLCYYMGDLTLEDVCKACDVNPVFLLASAVDRTIKEFDQSVYYREMYVGPEIGLECPYTLDALEEYYRHDGYYSMMQSDANRFGMEEEKLINRIAIDFLAIPQAIPNKLYVQVGYGQQSTCLRWKSTPERDFACLTEKTDEEHLADNTRAAQPASFPTFTAGSYLSWRFYLNGTGGGGCLNQVTQHVRIKSGTWR